MPLTIAQLKVVNARAPSFVLLLAVLRVLDASEQPVPLLLFSFDVILPWVFVVARMLLIGRIHVDHAQFARVVVCRFSIGAITVSCGSSGSESVDVSDLDESPSAKVPGPVPDLPKD